VVAEMAEVTLGIEPNVLKPLTESLTILGKEEADPGLLASFKGAEKRRYLELAKINRPQPVKSAEPKGRVHRYTYPQLIDMHVMLPILKDPKRGSPLPWCWYSNCGCFYSGGYAQFCANLVFEFITSPKLKLDQIQMKAIYIGAGQTVFDGDLLFEDMLSIAVLDAQVQRKGDVTYVVRYNYFGDRVPITAVAATESEKAKEADSGATDNKTPEILLIFRCSELKELLERLRPQQGEFEFDQAKGKASEMLGKFATDKNQK